ncbi:MAG: exosortase system-associated protein, TIGR04073 family [Methylococcaceae bacterium]|nr:exosortase system-associated protein, TIGR04073 family [Methylococcaceae bacterium]
MNYTYKLLLFALFIFMPYQAMAHSYPAKIGEKLGTGIANIVTGVVEIPKTMTITTRTHGPGYGMTAGFMTGIVHMLGRTLSGALDVATFMIPTRPIVRPDFVWKNFNTETSYNPNWQMR